MVRKEIQWEPSSVETSTSLANLSSGTSIILIISPPPATSPPPVVSNSPDSNGIPRTRLHLHWDYHQMEEDRSMATQHQCNQINGNNSTEMRVMIHHEYQSQ